MDSSYDEYIQRIRDLLETMGDEFWDEVENIENNDNMTESDIEIAEEASEIENTSSDITDDLIVNPSGSPVELGEIELFPIDEIPAGNMEMDLKEGWHETSWWTADKETQTEASTTREIGIQTNHLTKNAKTQTDE